MARRWDPVLFQEQLRTQLAQIDLLMAMYPADDELIVDSSTRDSIEMLRTWCETDDKHGPGACSTVPDTLTFELHVALDTDELTTVVNRDDKSYIVQLSIEVPVHIQADNVSGRETSSTSIRVRLRQPAWLNRSQTTQINASIPPDCKDDIVASIEHIRDESGRALHSSSSSSSSTSSFFSSTTTGVSNTKTNSQPLVRVWFYFPSLSTRSKRNDLVTFTTQYALTGFVLAGKPGILCLEGEARNIDGYMRVIKTESWGDIPSHQKKVSERFREVIYTPFGDDAGRQGGDQGRVFEGMQEITGAEWLGDRRGERGNRSDLGVVEDWLAAKGLGGVFERVLR